MSRRRRFKQSAEPARCKCAGGPDCAKEHAKPGKTAADHGDPYVGRGSCIHSELQHTTRGLVKRPGARRLRLQ